MILRFHWLLVPITLAGVVASAQTDKARKLGPATANSIQVATLDPAFQTSKLDRVAVLPFANTARFQDAASIISKNLVSQLSQAHAEYKFVAPDEMMNFISTSGLNDDFNVFLGDYLASGTAKAAFLEGLRSKLKIDAVLVGQINAWGDTNVPVKKLANGKVITHKMRLVGVEMSLYRTTDGRRIWYGKDLIAPPNQARLQEATEVISNVFARFFGRVPY